MALCWVTLFEALVTNFQIRCKREAEALKPELDVSVSPAELRSDLACLCDAGMEM
jgi:hypothetical protein